MFRQLSRPDPRPESGLLHLTPARNAPAPRRRPTVARSAMMRRWVGGLTALVAIGVSGCADPISAAPPVSPVRSSASEPAATSSAARNVGATSPYELYTHCGIREALIDKNYYVASPVLDDGNGNPPKGWGNPYNSGTMTVNPDKTADFHDSAAHRAHFVLRPGATTWLQICS